VELVTNSFNLSDLLYQHNEHRIGTGLFVMKFLASLSSWNIRYETYFTGILILASSVFALLLKKKLFKKLDIFDIFIPYIFLNLYQWENLLWGFQIAFVLPLFFLFISLYLFTFRASFLRNILVSIIVLFSAYSSFHGWEGKKGKKHLLSLVLPALFVLSTYFIGYEFRTKNLMTGIEEVHLLSVLQYLCFQINNYVGNQSYGTLFYFLPVLFLFLFLVVLYKTIKVKGETKYFIILSVFLYSFLFMLFTVTGRLHSGVHQAMASRYVTHMTPLFFGSYLVLRILWRKKRKNLLFILIFLFACFSAANNHLNYNHAEARRKKLVEWKDCFLENGIVSDCNENTKYFIYPIFGDGLVQSKMKILEEKNLNLFNGK